MVIFDNINGFLVKVQVHLDLYPIARVHNYYETLIINVLYSVCHSGSYSVTYNDSYSDTKLGTSFNPPLYSIVTIDNVTSKPFTSFSKHMKS